ncbi:MAG: GAF domain-containing protein [Caldilinea sp. CFX5]|nr:GAF domain-containing protein [Caldilinea sp. CFX5]
MWGRSGSGDKIGRQEEGETRDIVVNFFLSSCLPVFLSSCLLVSLSSTVTVHRVEGNFDFSSLCYNNCQSLVVHRVVTARGNMTILSGYQITETIAASATIIVYRGRRLRDQQTVILKMVRADYPALADVARLKREYEISKGLSISGVTQVCGLEQWGHSPVLVLLDGGGVPLDTLLATAPLDLLTFLKIAIQLAETVGQIHQRNIIHKDLKPANLYYNPTTQQVQIADFSIATRLSQQNQSVSNPATLEGTLAYLSPEQTGRMNRVIDYRSDFYALGVTFYELLTGRLPFAETDPMDLVHAHLAKQPRPPSELDPTLPPVLSAIVMKLLAKTAEERYQSADGLKADLVECLAQWQATGAITTFVLGQQDRADRFQIPQKLYGRAEEIQQLLAAFARVSAAQTPANGSAGEANAKGCAELLLVAGYSGSGKSALVHEIHKPIARQKGYFIAGKFDQYQRNIPYRALILAFQELVRQLLTESATRISLWRARMNAALGGAGQVIIDVIPEVERILGPQPAIAVLPPTEAQNRFNRLFTRFLQVFTRPEQPLVIFLDDLQWADAATLRLLQTLLSDGDLHHLLLIGAYRDNEVSATHPLKLALAEIAKHRPVSHIALGPLDLCHLNQLVSETLKCDDATALPLAHLLLEKTAGNPFFVRQFLLSLYQEALLTFDPNQGQWRFVLSQIEQKGMTDNVVTLMAGKIQKLAQPTQHVLQLAACVGNRFDVATLAIVNESSFAQAAAALWPAVVEGLLLPVGNDYALAQASEVESQGAIQAESNPESSIELLAATEAAHTLSYRFLHDRVQQAAYALIPDQQRKAVHLKVGQLLLAKSDEATREEKLFEIVNQFNLGQALLGEPSARRELAHLNLLAGRKAKAAAAYKAALGYFQIGCTLLPKTIWRADYEFAFALTLERAEGEFLCGQFAEAEQTFQLLLAQAQSRLDQARVYSLQVHQYEALTHYADAIRVGHAALALFDVTFPQLAAEKEAALAAELAAIDALVGDRPIDALLDLPIQHDAEGQMVMKLLSDLHTACYLVGDKTLTLLNTAKMVRLSLQHGHTPESAHGYVLHAMNIGPIGGHYQAAYDFGLLALRLNERLPNPGLRAKILMNFSWAISPWRRPWAESFAYTQEAFQLGNENGFFSDAGFALFNDTYQALLAGRDLASVHQVCTVAVAYLKGKMDGFIDGPQTILQWVQALRGETVAPTSLTNADYDEVAYRQRHQQHPLFLMFHYIAKLALCYTFNDYKAASATAEAAEQVIREYTGTIWDALRVFYHALTLAALYPTFSRRQQQKARQLITALCARMKPWADNCPENFRHHYLLMTAERARLVGQTDAAMRAYEEAIQVAHTQGLTPNEALANELYARFWLARQQEKIARLYLLEAVAGYEQWGALAKVKDLRQQYPHLLAPTARPAPAPGKARSITAETTATALDWAAAMKAAQAISREIDLATLLESLLRVVMATAGAQKGCLILEKAGEWCIEAAGSVDQAAIPVLQAIPVESSQDLAAAIVNYVKHTGENLVIADATEDQRWSNDPYILQQKPKSILCTPILNRAAAVGLLYLENNRVSHAFTPDRIELIQLLSAQAAISLANARLYEEMKLEVRERRRVEASLRQSEGQLRQLNEQLEDYSRNLAEKVRVRTHEIEQRQRVAESLRDMLTILNSNRPLDEILAQIVMEACRLLHSDSSMIYQLEDVARGLFRIQRAHGVLAEHLAANDFPNELIGQILQGQWVAIADLAAPGWLPSQPPTASHIVQHCRALLALPLAIGAESYGCLLLCYAMPHPFTEEEIALAIAFRDQAMLAIENARLRARVEQAAVAVERGRLARELHDSVTQSLYSLTLLTAGWNRLAQAGQQLSVTEMLTEAGAIAQQALKEMRLLVHELRPPDLEKVGLLGALHQRLSAVEKRAGVEVRFRTDEEVALPLFVQEGLYRIAQEALNNAIKHASATCVTVSLHSNAAGFELVIADNGCGFDPSQGKEQGGLGLISMHERAEKFGGQLTIASAPGKGAQVRITVPFTSTAKQP